MNTTLRRSGDAPNGGLILLLLAFALGAGGQTQTNYQQLMFFDAARIWGPNPTGGVALGIDGQLYTSTVSTSLGNSGAVVDVKADGTSHGVVINLPSLPLGTLLVAEDGTLFGTTETGGDFSGGSVFRVNADGSGYTNLHSFGAITNDGGNVVAGVVFGKDGALYGTTYQGGANDDCGIIFRVNTDGTGYQILHQFSTNAVAGAAVDAANPVAVLCVGADGTLYGTARGGGSTLNSPYTLGAIFKLNPDGSDYAIIHSFDFSVYDVETPLAFGNDGMLYGTASYGGLFSLSANGSGFTNTYSLTAPGGGSALPSGLTLGPDEAFYGTTYYGGNTNATYENGMGTVFRFNPDGTDFETLYSFSGEDGRNPSGALVVAGDGALYGSTEYGGYQDQGTVFKLSSAPPTSVSIIDAIFPSGGFLLTCSGAPNQSWTVQGRSSLASSNGWQALTTTNTDAYGLFRFQASDATNSASRFYRAVRP